MCVSFNFVNVFMRNYINIYTQYASQYRIARTKISSTLPGCGAVCYFLCNRT